MMRRTATVAGAVFILAGGIAFALSDPGDLSNPEQQWIDSIPQSDKPIANTSGVFETRFSQPRGSSLQSMFKAPKVVHISVTSDGQGGLSTNVDVQALFPGSAVRFAHAVATFSHYDLFSYRTIYSADKSPSDPELGYHMQIQVVSTGVLGITETYLFATNNYGETLPGGAYGFKWNLERSYHNAFREMRGSWYLKPVTYHGEECTYLRYYDHSDFSKAPPIPLPILQDVIAADYRELLTDVFHHLR